MKKINVLLFASLVSFGSMSSFNPITTYAAEIPAIEAESNALGGWNEENGYYRNPQAFSKAMGKLSTYSTPKHTGKAEQQNYNGTTRKRAHGWTTWVGTYHYTRARMEDGGIVLTDSKRQWGQDGTEAISPWWSFDGNTLGTARTYYGSDS